MRDGSGKQLGFAAWPFTGSCCLLRTAGSTPGGAGKYLGSWMSCECECVHEPAWENVGQICLFFFGLISVFSGNDFPSVEVGLSFRKEQRSAVG